VRDIAEFLRAQRLFGTLSPEQAERLAGRAEIEYFAAGETIFRQGIEPPDDMWVVRTGAVELLDNDRVLDLLGEGEPFGFPWMLAGLPTGWQARARENSLCYRLKAEDVLPLFSDEEGLRSVARALMDRPRPGDAPTSRVGELDAGHETVQSLIRKPPVVCGVDVPLRDAAGQMEDQGVSATVVRLPDGDLGIVTDRDLRSLIADGRSLDVPVGEVMTSPVYTVGPERTSAELMLTMIDRGIRHVPVVTARGELLGVVTDIDLLASETRTPIMLRRAIADAANVDALRQPAAQLSSTLVAMHEAGVAPARISAILSVVVDALVRRLIELAIAAHGPPPAEIGWLSLGSFGRREAVPSSDADSGMAWADTTGDPSEYMHALAEDVVGELAKMGWRADPHGVTAAGVMSASSMADWRTSIMKWVKAPVSEAELIAVSIVLDGRIIYGSEREFDVPGLLREHRPLPRLLRLLLRQALAAKPPTGFLRDIVLGHSSEHAGQLDIKHGGLLPIVNIARYAALAAGASTTSTIERLRAAGDAGVLKEADAATLVEAFELFSELRLAHQVEQLAASRPPDNEIDPKTLNPLERRYLRDSFRAVASVQKGLGTKLSWET
jgi:CBS domain-containing protein